MKRSNIIILSIIGFLAVIFVGYFILLVLTTPKINFPKTIITKAQIIQNHGAPLNDGWLYSGKLRRKVNILCYNENDKNLQYFFINNKLLNITDNYISYLTSMYELGLIDPVVYRVKVDEFQRLVTQVSQKQLEEERQKQVMELAEEQQKMQGLSMFMGMWQGMQNTQALRGIQKSIDRPRKTSGTFYNYRTGDIIQYRGKSE